MQDGAGRETMGRAACDTTGVTSGAPPLEDAALARALDAHRARLAACRACGLDGAHVQPILSLARAPRVMLVGQAPGKTEVGTARPFSGRAGRTLFRWLERAGIEEGWFREHVYMAAVTRCYPGPHPAGRGDRVPTPRERAACGPWLDAELAAIRPRVLILVGRLAIDRFLGAGPLDALVGRMHEVTHVGGTSLAVPLPHPSGASSWIHAPGHDVLLGAALERLGGALRAAGVLPAAAGGRGSPLRSLPAAALALAALAGPLRGQDAVAAVTPPAPAGVARTVPPTPLVPASAGVAAPAPTPVAIARDAWVGPDKVKHFFLASFVQGAAHSGFRATGAGARSSLGLAGAVTSVVSVGKEWHDRRTTGFSARDLVWDAAGAGVMTLLLRRTAR